MKLVVNFHPPSVNVAVASNPYDINIGKSVVKEYLDERPFYEGDYVVEPSAQEDIVLETKNKAMRDDVTVTKIYYAEVTNPANGITAYIAHHV